MTAVAIVAAVAVAVAVVIVLWTVAAVRGDDDRFWRRARRDWPRQ